MNIFITIIRMYNEKLSILECIYTITVNIIMYTVKIVNIKMYDRKRSMLKCI